MFFNNFINNIIKSMMAVCAVANGWSSGDVLTENPFRGNKSVVLAGSNSGDAKRSWADVVKGGQQGESPKMVNTTTFSSKGSSKPDKSCSGYNNAHTSNEQYDAQDRYNRLNIRTTNCRISFPESMSSKHKQDFLKMCEKYSINDTNNQIICALNALSGSEFVEFYKLNLERINTMPAKDFASLSDCLYEQFDAWQHLDICGSIRDKIIQSVIELGLLEKGDKDKVTDFKTALMALGEYLS